MSAPGNGYPDLHTVVFDVNIYLDVAELVGPPFTWGKFDDLAVRHQASPLPHPSDGRVDSLRAIAVSLAGRFAGPELLQVWSSAHIDDLVPFKAAQPATAPTPEERGLGWSTGDAEALLVDLVDELVYEKTGGGCVERVGIDGRPPLSHEDACVFTTARFAAADEAPPPIRYCVTRDRRFRTADGLNPNVQVLYPAEFVDMVRRSRHVLAMPRPRPPASS